MFTIQMEEEDCKNVGVSALALMEAQGPKPPPQPLARSWMLLNKTPGPFREAMGENRQGDNA